MAHAIEPRRDWGTSRLHALVYDSAGKRGWTCGAGRSQTAHLHPYPRRRPERCAQRGGEAKNGQCWCESCRNRSRCDPVPLARRYNPGTNLSESAGASCVHDSRLRRPDCRSVLFFFCLRAGPPLVYFAVVPIYLFGFVRSRSLLKLRSFVFVV